MHKDRKSDPALQSVGNKKPGRKYQLIFRQPGSLLETLEAFRPILANGLVLSFIGVLNCIFTGLAIIRNMAVKSTGFCFGTCFAPPPRHADSSNPARSVIQFITQCNNTITGVIYEEHHTIATHRDRRRA
jgi:hypothetical protein